MSDAAAPARDAPAARPAATVVGGLLAAALGAASLPSVAGLAARWPELDPSTPATAGLALVLGVLAVMPVVLVPRRSGLWSLIALGSAAAFFAALMSIRGFETPEQLSLAVLAALPAALALLVGSQLMMGGPPWAWAAWVAVVVATRVGVEMVGSTAAPAMALGETPAAWVVMGLAAVLVGWCVVSLVSEQPAGAPNDPEAAVRRATVVALAAVALGALGLTLVGQSDWPTAWLRPVTWWGLAVTVATLLIAAALAPRRLARARAASAVIAALALPALAGLTIGHAAETRTSWFAIAAAFGVGIVGGAAWAGLRCRAALSWSPFVVVAGAAVTWALLDWWWAITGVAAVAAGLVAQAAAALGDARPARDIPVVVAPAFVVGTLACLPLTWSLTGASPDPAADVAGTWLRVVLGLLVAGEAMVAAAVWVAERRDAARWPEQPALKRGRVSGAAR